MTVICVWVEFRPQRRNNHHDECRTMKLQNFIEWKQRAT